VWVKVGSRFHDPGCYPTLYVELDGRPVVPPDPGEAYGEFESTASENEACVRAEFVEGNFLYVGRHVVGIGTGCNPDEPGPYITQRHFAFDGNAGSLVSSDEPLEFCDHSRYLDELRRPPTDEELDRLVETTPDAIRDEAAILVESARAHREGDDSISETGEVQAAADRFDEYVTAEC
jgi:hypothetical protein